MFYFLCSKKRNQGFLGFLKPGITWASLKDQIFIGLFHTFLPIFKEGNNKNSDCVSKRKLSSFFIPLHPSSSLFILLLHPSSSFSFLKKVISGFLALERFVKERALKFYIFSILSCLFSKKRMLRSSCSFHKRKSFIFFLFPDTFLDIFKGKNGKVSGSFQRENARSSW
jgi:hypothetical protein